MILDNSAYEFFVSGDVRLSNDTSVKVSDGGLSVNVDIDVDTASNQLTLKVGNRTKIVSLPGIQIVKNIRYDEKTASIVIELTDSSTPLTIPVSDMIETIYVQKTLQHSFHNNKICTHTRSLSINSPPRYRCHNNQCIKPCKTRRSYQCLQGSESANTHPPLYLAFFFVLHDCDQNLNRSKIRRR